MPTSQPDLAALRGRVGAGAALTAWERFDQAAVDAYGRLTGESLWVHSDPARAAASGFGGTIVQSSLLMARFGAWIQAVGLWLPEPATPLNYGYDRVRIPGALRVGEAVRGRVSLASMPEPRAGMIRLELDVVAERDSEARPVLAARWLVAFIYPDETE